MQLFEPHARVHVHHHGAFSTLLLAASWQAWWVPRGRFGGVGVDLCLPAVNKQPPFATCISQCVAGGYPSRNVPSGTSEPHPHDCAVSLSFL